MLKKKFYIDFTNSKKKLKIKKNTGKKSFKKNKE